MIFETREREMGTVGGGRRRKVRRRKRSVETKGIEVWLRPVGIRFPTPKQFVNC